MKKIIASVCAAVMLFSGFASAVDIQYGEKEANPNLVLPENPGTKMVNGTIAIEAEKMEYDEHIKVITDQKASGGRALNVASGQPAMSLEATPEKPEMYIEFLPSGAGSYNIWARVKTPDSGSDSVYYALNSDFYSMYSFDDISDYYWVNLGTMNIGSSDKCSIGFKHREMNFTLDKLLITNNLAFTPVGMDDMPSADEEGKGYDLWPEPEIKPIAGHPRLFLTKDHIAHLNHNMESRELAPTFKVMEGYADEVLEAKRESKAGGNYSDTIELKIEARALMYVLGRRDANHAKQTIQYAKDYLSTVEFPPNASDITRRVGYAMVMGAVVYDWCYDQLTEQDKKDMILYFKQLATMKEIGYPPVKMSGIGTHAGEFEIMRDMISVGVAVYDEDTEMYNLAAGRFFDEYVESRKLFNSSGNHPQGSSYGSFRYECELWAEIIFERMGYPNILGEDMADVAYKWFYERLPIGAWFKDGDDAVWSKNKYFTFTTHDQRQSIMSANFYKDPYLRRQYIKTLSLKNYGMEHFWLLLFAEPDVGMKETNDLPLARKTTYPLSGIVARTSWQTGLDAPTAMAQMKVQEEYIADHMHLDSGAFQLYYKGSLAVASGIYQGQDGEHGGNHYSNYYVRTIAHNAMTITDPQETDTYLSGGNYYSNDGGQRREISGSAFMTYEEMIEKEDQASTKGIYIGPNEYTPKFSYIKGDLAAGYGDKVEEYNRSMVFMDLFDEDYPAAFVVFDKVKAADKTFKKRWNLHSIEEPQINGNVTTIKRTEKGFNGKLVNTSLLPEKVEINKVGGNGGEYTVNGKNYPNRDYAATDTEGAKWRIEISPAKEQESDTFLNAMYVTDADGNLPQLPMETIKNSKMTGVSVRDRIVMFSTDAKSITESMSLVIPENGFDTVSVMLADIKSGTWKVSGNDTELVVNVNEDEGVVYFEGKPGTYRITPAQGETPTEISYAREYKTPIGDFLLYQGGLFLNQPNPTKEIDSVPYVPIRGVIEQYGIEIAYEEETKTVVLTNELGKQAKFRNGETTCIIDGQEIVLENTPRLIDGSTYICLDDFKDFLMLQTVYDDYGKILKITVIDRSFFKAISTETIFKPITVTASGNDGNVPENTADNDMLTRWSEEGDYCWLLYDLGQAEEFGKILLGTYNGSQRSFKFDIEISDDAKSFKKIYSGSTSGKTDGLETFTFAKAKARYVRLVGYGNSANKWNSVTEFMIAK